MPAPATVLALSRDPTLIATAQAALRDQPGLRLVLAADGVDGADLRGARVVLLDVDARQADAIAEVERLARAAPGRLLVVAPDAGGADLRRLFRAGATDVVTEPGPEPLRAALAELLDARRTAAAQSCVVCVIKGCGGAGATTVATNLAATLAAGGGRAARGGRRTALLDLDLQFGDAAVALDLEPRSTVVDVIQAADRVDVRFLQSVMTEHRSGLKLLAAPATMVPLDAFSAAAALRLVEQAASGFERTIVDLPASLTDWTLPVLRRADLIVLVTTPTVAGAVGARRLLDGLKDAGVDRPVLLTLNKLPGLIETLDRPGRIARSLERTVDAVLPLDPQAGQAADRGELITAAPRNRLAKALAALAAKSEAQLAQTARPVSQLEAAE